MAIADARKTAEALETVAHQADASFVGVITLLGVLRAKGALDESEHKAIADVMAGHLPTDRQYDFEQAVRATLPRYRTPKRKYLAEQNLGGVVFPDGDEPM